MVAGSCEHEVRGLDSVLPVSCVKCKMNLAVRDGSIRKSGAMRVRQNGGMRSHKGKIKWWYEMS
ncbi:hypothetical protein AMTR_s00080p00137120 [Amborella trichopoda]|uniref:Uncharacterized protein n=1 Tax=Amborella trichopoda TaxID=13333 RepID=W1P4X9_AMBTC|nr:hypothetical protein AMTR_s00080p00137120 [Amborella trichopoda]